MNLFVRIRHTFPLLEDNDGSNGGGNTQNEEGTQGTDGTELNLPQGIDELAFYRNSYNAMVQTNNKLQDQIFQILEKVGGQQQTQQQKPVIQLPEPDFDNMTNKELVKHLTTVLPQIVKEAVGGDFETIRNEVAEVKTSHHQDSLERRVQECLSRYPDYLLYQPEMVRYSTEHPDLGPKEVYAIVKNEVGPRFVTTRNNQQTNTQQGSNNTNPQRPGVERPNSIAGATQKEKYKSTAEAIDAAISGLPDNLRSLFK